MPKLFSSDHIIKVLKKNGFTFVSQKGSHEKYFNEETMEIVIVPANRKEIPFGTFKSILRQSGLSREDF